MYNGNEVSPGENLQFIVLITILTETDGWHCTGTLIAPSWVITAGNCFPPNIHDVYLQWGDKKYMWGRQCKKEPFAMIFHEETRRDRIGKTDLALLRISDCSDGPEPVRLGEESDLKQKNISNCIIAGFGSRFEDDDDAPKLQKMEVNFSDLDFGNRTGRIGFKGGKEGRGPCIGDSGGPLLCNGKLYGVLSSTGLRGNQVHKCGSPNVQHYYEDVTGHLSWINHTMKHNCGTSQIQSTSFLTVIASVMLTILIYLHV